MRKIAVSSLGVGILFHVSLYGQKPDSDVDKFMTQTNAQIEVINEVFRVDHAKQGLMLDYILESIKRHPEDKLYAQRLVYELDKLDKALVQKLKVVPK